MTANRTRLGPEVEVALGEVLDHVRGEVDLPCRIADDREPGAVRRPFPDPNSNRPAM